MQLYITYRNYDNVILVLSDRYKTCRWEKKLVVSCIEKLVRTALKRVIKLRNEFLPKFRALPPLELD